MSNWYMCEVPYKGHIFQNSEQAFMWEKAKHFGDEETANLILAEPNPSRNKKLGRQVKGFDAEEWARVSYDIMYEVNVAKYENNDDLARQLKNTGNKLLVEASPYDKIWGIGLCAEEARVTPKDEWQGTN